MRVCYVFEIPFGNEADLSSPLGVIVLAQRRHHIKLIPSLIRRERSRWLPGALSFLISLLLFAAAYKR